MFTISSPVLLTATVEEVVANYESVDVNSLRTGPVVWHKVEVSKSGQGRAHGWQLADEETGDLRGRLFWLRGDKVYEDESDCGVWVGSEWIKAVGLTIAFPVYSLVQRILIPIVIYLPVRALASLFGRCEVLQRLVKNLDDFGGYKRAWEFLTPLRAIVGLVLQAVVGVFALVPGLSNYFNKINGDIERWINGHTDKDLETKSKGQRLREGSYMAPCQQPLFKLQAHAGPLPKRISVENIEEPETKAIALRVLRWGNANTRPQIVGSSVG